MKEVVNINQLNAEALMKMMGSLFGPVGSNQFTLGNMVDDITNEMVGEIFALQAPKDPPFTKHKVIYDPTIKFSYYGKTGHANGHKGILVIASVVNDRDRVVHYGTAFCSPKDVYDKVKGKDLAYNDLCKNMSTVALRKKGHHEVNAGIFCDLIASGAYPSWSKAMVADQAIRHIQGFLFSDKDLLGSL